MVVKELYCDQLARQQVCHHYQNFRLQSSGADLRIFLLMKEELYAASRDIFQIPTFAHEPEKGIYNPLFEDYKLDVADALKTTNPSLLNCPEFLLLSNLYLS